MIYVTENGVSEKILCTELCDDWRIQYYKDYINEMLKGDTHRSICAFSLFGKSIQTLIQRIVFCGLTQQSKMESM